MLELEDDSAKSSAEAQDGAVQAVALIKKLRPEVVLMDIAMPLLANGLEAGAPGARKRLPRRQRC